VMSTTLPSWKDRHQGTFSKFHLKVPWRSIQLLVPHRLRRKLRSKLRNRQSPASSLTTLQSSFSPTHTIRALQSHRWSLYDGQYLLLAFLGIFSLCVIQSPGALVKTVVATLLLTSLVLPITRQFFLPFLPIPAWLIFFYAAS
jgi:inositol phosphorylceramide synthase catalytic subunit